MQRRHLLSGLLAVPALGAICVALPSGGARAARGNVVSGFPGIEGWLNAPAAFEPMASGWPVRPSYLKLAARAALTAPVKTPSQPS